jgi:hypothetical protein
MNNYSVGRRVNVRLGLFLLVVCVPTYAHAQDDITFDCSAIGYGYQTDDKSGPWQHEIGSFTWHYNASMLMSKQRSAQDGDQHGCEPVSIESPKIYIEKEIAVHIVGNRCGDNPSYFFAATAINGVSAYHALGFVDDVFRNKEIRIVLERAEELKIQSKDRRFGNVYFDCHFR